MVCTSIPRLRLRNGTVLSHYDEVKIEYGNPLELLCTGTAVNLQITKNGADLVINTVNETTVRFFTENPERQDTYYYCEDTQSNNATGVKVIVDSIPSTSDFHCKSKNLEYLNCSWTSLNIVPEFSLYYIKEEITYNFILCKLSNYDSKYCVWEKKNPSIPYQDFDQKLTFLMETCNRFGCANQTFVFNHVAIIQPDPPKLTLLQKSSRSAVLKWNIPWKLWLMDYLSLEHRISYWYSGIHQIKVDTASLEEKYVPTFEIELKLPCAGTFYEVRLSIRPKTAVGEEFWSEDAVITFVTDQEPQDLVDPTCIRPRVTITPEIMLYEIEKLRDKMEIEQKELDEQIMSLKERVGKSH